MTSWRADLGEAFSGRRALVTGATGFIGRRLCEALGELGAETHGAARGASAATLPAGCSPCPVDLEDERAVHALFAGLRPDLVFHLAGRVTARQELALVLPMLRQNLVATVHVLLAAAESGAGRVVYAGSSEEGDGEPPASPYAAAKASATLWAQLFARTYGLPVAIVRPFFVYGPGQEVEKLVPSAVLALLRGEPPRVRSAERRCDFVYLDDAVRGLLLAALRSEAVGEATDLGSGRATRILDLVELLIDLTGADVAPAFEDAPRPGEASRAADTAKAARVLGWEPRTGLREGLRATIDWYGEVPAVAR